MADARPINYYDVLGIAVDATAGTIKTAYKQRVAHYHPDRNSSRRASALTALVNDAYDVLGDAAARALYDIEMGFATIPFGGRPARRSAPIDGGAPADSFSTRSTAGSFWMPRGFQWVIIWFVALGATLGVMAPLFSGNGSTGALLAVWVINALLVLWAIEARRRHRRKRSWTADWITLALVLIIAASYVALQQLIPGAARAMSDHVVDQPIAR